MSPEITFENIKYGIYTKIDYTDGSRIADITTDQPIMKETVQIKKKGEAPPKSRKLFPKNVNRQPDSIREVTCTPHRRSVKSGSSQPLEKTKLSRTG